MTQTKVRTIRGGTVMIETRADTSDEALVNAIVSADEYRLRDLPHPLDGWALDIGAHVGSVAMALATDHPGLHVVAVEPVPENAAMIERSARAAGFADRLHVVAAAAGAPGDEPVCLQWDWDLPEGHPDRGHARQSRFIANGNRHSDWAAQCMTVPAVSLDDLLERFGIDEVAFVKIDCETCEWRFLATPAVARIRLIVGEFHDRYAPAIVSLLEGTHEVDILTDPAISPGLFRATRRVAA